MQDHVDELNARPDAQQHAGERHQPVLPQDQPPDLLLVIAQHLERRVFARALHEVHQAHVVADDERQRERDAREQREHGGERLQHARHVRDLRGRVVDVVHLIHGVQLR